LDLDGARPLSGPADGARDLARFAVEVEEAGLSRDDLECFIDAYLGSAGADRESLLAALLPWLETFRERHARRYGTPPRPLVT
jgi:hypothetical protein